MASFDTDRPRHQPIAPEAPIPGRHWYSGCDPDGGYVDEKGICNDCGGHACPECGAGFYADGGCKCPKTEVRFKLIDGTWFKTTWLPGADDPMLVETVEGDECIGCSLGDASPSMHDYGYGCEHGKGAA